MFLHVFEVVTPDGDIVHTSAMMVTTPEREVRVRHRLVEIDPPEDREDEAWGMTGEDWEDFDLDEVE